MKPFLLLATRAEDAAADNEYESFLKFAGLAERDLRRVRLERGALGPVDLQEWSGFFLGGSPFTVSDPEDVKSPVQRRVEADLRGLLGRVIGADFPFLGTCYGIGALGSLVGAVIDRRYAEPVGPVTITLTRQGRQDPLLAACPPRSTRSPATRRRSAGCPGRRSGWPGPGPARCMRSGSAPMSTPPSSIPNSTPPACTPGSRSTRIAGYFPPGQADELKTRAGRADVTHPPAILRRFAQRYACPDPAPAAQARLAATK